MRRKAFLYIRVSTDEQADKGYSLKHQEERLQKYCEMNNIEVVAIYQDDYSAKTFNRPEFNRLLGVLRKHRGKVDLLLFTKWDRFSRNTGDAYGMINTLNKLGVDPQAIEQPLDLSIPENKIMLAFYLAAPEVENDRRALNVFVGMRRAKKEGRWMASAPRGYKNTITEDLKKSLYQAKMRRSLSGPLKNYQKEFIILMKYGKHAKKKDCSVAKITSGH
jgi:site-specific DNA recombinase